MSIAAEAVFFASLVLIALLFASKMREIAAGKSATVHLRDAADREALRAKELLFAAKIDLTKMFPLLVYWAHVAVHFAALEFARGARAASRKAHQLADFVSHKRNFQRRQTRSEFLRRMSLRKQHSAGGQESDERVES